ncbi:hypothetical protein L596_004805 [Steinernema carpocapsae]|uniref:Uncharacterized protein n=1 Tax=Steinernema carpocapsae TaxID=34508 RepID=A0A4U8UX78_STECR|nr:hypothetical protein L596_004805 [Steinernema carpocapsae]
MNLSLCLFLLLSFICIDALIIYRRTPKPKLVCREERDWHSRGSNFSAELDVVENSDEVLRVVKRAANSEEPVIFLNTEEPKSATDNDFDLVSDALSDEEKKIVKEKIIKTCNALKLN